MGVRRRAFTIFALACLFLSLISWANKHRLSIAGQVRACGSAHKLISDTPATCQTMIYTCVINDVRASTLQLSSMSCILQGKRQETAATSLKGRQTSHALLCPCRPWRPDWMGTSGPCSCARCCESLALASCTWRQARGITACGLLCVRQVAHIDEHLSHIYIKGTQHCLSFDVLGSER